MIELPTATESDPVAHSPPVVPSPTFVYIDLAPSWENSASSRNSPGRRDSETLYPCTLSLAPSLHCPSSSSTPLSITLYPPSRRGPCQLQPRFQNLRAAPRRGRQSLRTANDWTNPASLLELPLADSTILESIRKNPMITRTMTCTVEAKD